MKRYFRNIISIFTSVSFLFPNLIWAFEPEAYALSAPGPLSIYYQNKLLDIPPQLGSIVKAFPGRAKTIIHIQDLHCNNEAQHHIANIIHLLAKEHGLKLVGEEGAFHSVDISPIRTFPIPEIRKAVSDYFVRQGKLTGAEYYGGTGEYPIELQGIETPKLYLDSLQALRAFLNSESQGYCLDVRALLDSLKPGIYNQTLLALDNLQTAYRSGRLDVLAYVARLKNFAGQNRIALTPYPHLANYLRQDRPQAETDHEQLFREMDELDRVLRERLYTSNLQRELDAQCSRLDIIEKLLNISATQEELQEFRQERNMFTAKAFLDFIRQQKPANAECDPELDNLDQCLARAEAFYRLADMRSRHFVANLIREMDRRQEKLAVMITGGFHTADIANALQEQGIGYLSIQPRLTRQDVANPYFAILQGKKLPIEKLLARNQTILAPRVLPETPGYQPLVAVSYGAFGLSALSSLPAHRQQELQKWLQGRHAIVALTRLTAAEVKAQTGLQIGLPEGCEIFLAQSRQSRPVPLLLIPGDKRVENLPGNAIRLQDTGKFGGMTMSAYGDWPSLKAAAEKLHAKDSENLAAALLRIFKTIVRVIAVLQTLPALSAPAPKAHVKSNANQRSFPINDQGGRIILENPEPGSSVQTQIGRISSGISMLDWPFYADKEKYPRAVVVPDGDLTGKQPSINLAAFYIWSLNIYLFQQRTPIIVCTQKQQKQIIAYLKSVNPSELPTIAGYPQTLLESIKTEADLLYDRDPRVAGHPKFAPWDILRFVNWDGQGQAELEKGKMLIKRAEEQTKIHEQIAGVWQEKGLQPRRKDITLKVEGVQPLKEKPEFGVTVLGSGSAMNPETMTSNFIVWAGKGDEPTGILVDMGPATVQLMKSLGIRPKDISHIMVSHVHEDHVGGTLELLQWFKEENQPVHFLGEPGIIQLLSSQLDCLTGQANYLQNNFSHEVLAIPFGGHTELERGANSVLRVEVERAFHGTPALMARFRYNGKTLAFSGDHTFHPARNFPLERARLEVIENFLFQGQPDLILHETGTQAPDSDTENTSNHTSPDTLISHRAGFLGRTLVYHTGKISAGFAAKGIRLAEPLHTYPIGAQKTFGALGNMNVGMTGATGSLGSPFVGQLVDRSGVSFHLISRSPQEAYDNGRLPRNPNINLNQAGLFNLRAMENIFKRSQVVYHLGGWARVGKTPSPAEALAYNSLAMVPLVRLARKYHTRLVFSSSGAVYLNSLDSTGGNSENDLRLSPELETFVSKAVAAFSKAGDELFAGTEAENEKKCIRFVADFLQANPLPPTPDLYGLTKIIAERLLAPYPEGISLRFWHVYGQGDITERRVPSLIRELSKPSAEPLAVARERIAFCYIDKALLALERAASCPLHPGNRIINVAGDELIDTFEVAGLIKKELNSSREIVESRQPGIQPLRIDNTLLKTELGITSQVDIAQGIKRTCEWFAENGSRHNSSKVPGAFAFWEQLGVSQVWAGRIEGAVGAAGYLALFMFNALFTHAPPSASPWLNMALHLLIPAAVVMAGFFIVHLVGVYGKEPADFRERLFNAVNATWVASWSSLLIPAVVASTLALQWLAPAGISLAAVATMAAVAGGWLHGRKNAEEAVTRQTAAVLQLSLDLSENGRSGMIAKYFSADQELLSDSTLALLNRAMIGYFKLDPAVFPSLGLRGQSQKYQIVLADVGWAQYFINLLQGRYLQVGEPAVVLPRTLLSGYTRSHGLQRLLIGRMILRAVRTSGQQRFRPGIMDRVLFLIAARFGQPNAFWQEAISAHQGPADPLRPAAALLQQEVFRQAALISASPSLILIKCYECLLPANKSGYESSIEWKTRMKMLQALRSPGHNIIKVADESREVFTLPVPDNKKARQTIIRQLRRAGIKTEEPVGTLQKIRNRHRTSA